jgi:hypothetical protein
MKQAAALLGERLAESGVVPGLARTAFATLSDNVLEHGE